MIDHAHAVALELIEELRDDRASAERRFQKGIGLVRALGVPVPEIASAAKLSTSRVHAILDRQARTHRVLDGEEIEHLLEKSFTVGIVPAGKIALHDYDRYGAYICQAHRPFRDEMSRIGFYAHLEISPHFPEILHIDGEVEFSAHEAARRRASADPNDRRIGEIIEEILGPGAGGGHRGNAHKVMLLSAPDDPRTLTLPAPIKHLERGRGQAFVRRQRYTSEAALRRHPNTTADLIRFERQ